MVSMPAQSRKMRNDGHNGGEAAIGPDLIVGDDQSTRRQLAKRGCGRDTP